MDRRSFLKLGGYGAGLLGAVSLAGCAAPTAPTPGMSSVDVTIGLSYVPNIQFAPFYVAEAQGMFDSVPGSVALRHHGGNESLFTALSAGRESFLVAGGAEAMQAHDAGVEAVAVASYYKAFPVRIIVPGDSQIHELADLKGRSLGIPGRFGETWLGVLAALSSAGLTEEDVNIVEVGFTQVSALSTGKVDAVVGFSTNEILQMQAIDPAARALAVGPGTVPLVSTCLLTTPTFIEEHPDIVQAVVASMTNGIEATAADVDAALQLSQDFIPGLDTTTDGTRDVLRASIDLMELNGGVFDPRLDEAQWADMASFLTTNGLVADDIHWGEFMTNEFANDM